MWPRLVEVLACPVCGGELELRSLREEQVSPCLTHREIAEKRGLAQREVERYVEAGLLVCSSCRAAFPVIHGLPVLIPYQTPIHAEFTREFPAAATSHGAYSFPTLSPVDGEQFVMHSFSREWLDYDYDGTIWDLSYEDHEQRFLAEIGPNALSDGARGWFLEIGCGIGLTTQFAAARLDADAIGVDLSLAALVAAKHFKKNPFLHFVQGSAFYLPVKRAIARVVYSHGVLHHTYSTRSAVQAIAPGVSENGQVYLWLYGPGSAGGSPLRRAAFLAEGIVRPAIARRLTSPVSRLALSAFACVYLLVNRFHRARDRSVASYGYRQALHAARDRFTPLFAHRHSFEEVSSWLAEFGFTGIEAVDWRTMPSANQDNYRRNTGIRARRCGGVRLPATALESSTLRISDVKPAAAS